MARKKAKVKRTAPNLDAVFNVIGEVAREEATAAVADSAERAKRHVVSLIKGNMAQPEPPGAFSAKYYARKVREGYDRRFLIRTGMYVNSISVFDLGADASKLARYKVGLLEGHIRAKKSVITLRQLGKILEFGTHGGPSKFHRRGIAPHPHWRPLAIWYRNQQAKAVRTRVSLKVAAIVKGRLKWRTTT